MKRLENEGMLLRDSSDIIGHVLDNTIEVDGIHTPNESSLVNKRPSGGVVSMV